MKDFILYWFPPLAWMAFIFPMNFMLTADSTSHIIVPILKWLLPQVSQATIDILHIVIRKFTHFFNYAFLAVLLYRAFRARRKTWRLEWIVYAGLIAVCYGALDEFLQTFIPLRKGSFYDWMIDSAGAIFVLSFIYIKGDLKLKGGQVSTPTTFPSFIKIKP